MMQPAFQQALLDPAQPVPDGLQDADGRPAGRRFDVYRNNVAVSLTEALRQAFPVLERLLGAEYFAALAGVFLRAHPPRSRLMMLYGTDMPGFLAGFPPLAHLPYLPDVARLEQALRESYHAADADPVAVERLAALSPDAFLAARLSLAPALRLIASDHPVLGIWQANTDPSAPPAGRGAQSVLILRPEFDPVPHLVSASAARFLSALLDGQTVGAALEQAGDDFDLNPVLALLIGGGAIVDLT